MPGLTPLTYQILLALADGDRHGYGIIKEIEQRSGSSSAQARRTRLLCPWTSGETTSSTSHLRARI